MQTIIQHRSYGKYGFAHPETYHLFRRIRRIITATPDPKGFKSTPQGAANCHTVCHGLVMALPNEDLVAINGYYGGINNNHTWLGHKPFDIHIMPLLPHPYHAIIDAYPVTSLEPALHCVTHWENPDQVQEATALALAHIFIPAANIDIHLQSLPGLQDDIARMAEAFRTTITRKGL